jgi:putative ABC transport system substrate-binding protein
MNKKNYRDIFFIIIYISGYLLVFPGHVYPGEEKQIAIAVSKRIRPYMNVIEGITKGLEKITKTPQVFFLSDSDFHHNEQVASKLKKSEFDLFVAVGPEAAELLWGMEMDLNLSLKRVFTAVLDPGRLLKKEIAPCGISLRIPVEHQVQEISKTFVNVKRIGLLFDSRNNKAFYATAALASKQYGIFLVPLRVESRNQIPQVLADNWENIDCVWMIPDRTVISEKIIQHIIKLGIYHKKGVIGYNSFFIRSGAVFSFDFDYRALGSQTAAKIETYFETGACQEEPPEFQTLMNQKMVDKIGLQVRQ